MYRGGGRSMVQKRGLSMVQKGGLSMVQLSVFQQTFFGKGAPRWYNFFWYNIFLGFSDLFVMAGLESYR